MNARQLYERDGFVVGRPNRAGWAMAKGQPPCHRSKSGRSFSINIHHGGFVCFGCDTRGSMVDFVMLRDHCNYQTARKTLGDNAPLQPQPKVLVPFLTLDFVIAGVLYHASVRDEPQTYADRIRRFYREASDRLIELSQGDSERYEGERERCWSRMECVVEELRELENL